MGKLFEKKLWAELEQKCNQFLETYAGTPHVPRIRQLLRETQRRSELVKKVLLRQVSPKTNAPLFLLFGGRRFWSEQSRGESAAGDK